MTTATQQPDSSKSSEKQKIPLGFLIIALVILVPLVTKQFPAFRNFFNVCMAVGLITTSIWLSYKQKQFSFFHILLLLSGLLVIANASINHVFDVMIQPLSNETKESVRDIVDFKLLSSGLIVLASALIWLGSALTHYQTLRNGNPSFNRAEQLLNVLTIIILAVFSVWWIFDGITNVIRAFHWID